MQPATELRTYVVGNLDTNCYVLKDGDECLVIDPGASGKRLAQELAGKKVVGIVATHRHHDHVGGVRALVEATGAPFMISEQDAEGATRAISLSSHVFDTASGEIEDAPVADVLLHDGDEVHVGSLSLRVIEAPGHTEGGIVLLGDGFAFVGDTLFKGSAGRTDLIGGDSDCLAKTLLRLKREIPPETTLFCGHGPATTMEYELATNPFLYSA